MKLHVFDGLPELYQSVATRVTDSLRLAIRQRGSATFVLTGGSTPEPLYRRLSETPYREQIRWDRIDFFWGDERCVPPQDPDSNFGMAWRSLLSSTAVPAVRLHRPRGELAPAERAAREYEQILRRFGHAPAFDLVLLGMGADGHTASLFPGTGWDAERLFVANHVPKLDAHRLTMTPKILNAAREVIFMVAGKDKAPALQEVLENDRCRLPARLVQPAAGGPSWFVDRAAASGLTRMSREEDA